MKIFKDILTDLRENKIAGIGALILIALLVSVPMTLAKPGEPTGATVMQPEGDVAAEGPQLTLTRASTTGFARPARVNDEQLDPFASRAKSGSLKKTADSLGSAADDVIGGDGTSSGGTGDDGSGDSGSGETPPTTKDPEVKTEQDDLLSILVTDGTAGAEPEQLVDIRTLSPLVDPEDPFLVYVGKTASGAASFLVSADVTVDGDGECAPTPQDCRTLTLGVAETAEFVYVATPDKKVTITILEIETKRVPVDTTAASTDTSASDVDATESDPDSGTQASLRRASLLRKAGAKALKSVLGDDEVVKSLAKQKVKIRS